ncbi:hypothetical protein [Sphingomonas sp.]|uniref:FliH/SctL family protein n=1 Tax=Sphingomonas sp. TaxID=28214 RepID=UPI0025F7CF56|nr:hypothetical protein [Sphingomonas sp.]
MSLIKAAHAEVLLRPPGGEQGGAGAAPIERAADPAILLGQRIAELEEELDLLKSGIGGRLEKARAEGLEAGRKQRDEKSAERLALIGDGIENALAAWEAKLSSTGQLAILIAKGALGRLIGNPEWRSELIVGSIEKRIAATDKAAIVRVRVSGVDFSADEITALGSTAGAQVEADPKLRSGECLVDLHMGHEELGVGAQWDRLAKLLDELATAAC